MTFYILWVLLSHLRSLLLVYFVSRTLHDAETRYSRLEKFALAVVFVSKLRPYFQDHSIDVLTDQPLARMLGNLDAAGRFVLWAVELTQFKVQYRPRDAGLGGFFRKMYAPKWARADGDGFKWWGSLCAYSHIYRMGFYKSTVNCNHLYLSPTD